jgi:putative component of toxin-antitoxin plasmid stabilization module
VKLFFKGEGFNGDLAGMDTSDRHGVWKIRIHPGAGRGFYYARVVRSKEDTAGTTFVCGGDRTKRIDTH